MVVAWAAGIVVVAALAAGVWWLFFAALPQRSGSLQLPGLSAPVTVTRDRWGIPHIHARTIADACQALGFCHAQDRLFQMELNRRVASGRLAELVGPEALDADRFLRRVGLRRAAEAESAQLDPEERALLEAYARGVNGFVEQFGDRLPLEFRLAKLAWEPWTIIDSLGWGKVLALNLATNAENEGFRAAVIARVGAERAALLEQLYPEGHPIALPPGARATDSSEELIRLYEAAKAFLPVGQTGASNNWVLAGSRTATGAPLLCNDPHLTLTAPSIWYEAQVVVEDDGGERMNVFGVTLPATPGVIIGHTAQVAWGFTNSGADVQDLFIERFNPAHPDEVEFQGQFEPVRTVREVIRVRGGSEVYEDVRITRHGPILSGGPRRGPALALRWTALDPGHGIRAVLKMNLAKSAAEFREALRDWPGPSQNVVFADRENIGFVMAGHVPMRKQGSGLTPVPGWSGEYEWTGLVPFEELPQAWNPPGGQIVTANNAIVGREFPHHITWDWLSGHRAARIEQLLNELPKVSAEDCARIQVDVFSAPGKAFARACETLKPRGALEARALTELRAWDGFARPESVGCSVYEAMMIATTRRALEPVLGRELVQVFMGKSDFPLAAAGLLVGRYTAFVIGALATRDTRIWQGLATPPSWDEVLQGALRDAVELCRARLGDDVSSWRWGALHEVRIRHPFGSLPLVGRIFAGPRAPLGGDVDTPLQAAVVPHQPFGADAWAPSWRQIVDLGERRRTLSVLASGQSGLPRSRHWQDQFPLWLRGELKAVLTDPADVAAHSEGTLRLLPVAS